MWEQPYGDGRAAARATIRSCWSRRQTSQDPEQRMLRAALEGLAGRAGARARHHQPPRAAASPIAVPANARLVDWVSYAQTMPLLRRGGLPRGPRHGGAGAGVRGAGGRVPGGGRHGRERARVSLGRGGRVAAAAAHSPRGVRLALRKLLSDGRYRVAPASCATGRWRTTAPRRPPPQVEALAARSARISSSRA